MLIRPPRAGALAGALAGDGVNLFSILQRGLVPNLPRGREAAEESHEEIANSRVEGRCSY